LSFPPSFAKCAGKKCKFSHDLSVERKTEKKNLYADTRNGAENGDDAEDKAAGGGGKDETVDDWDEEKLRKVVMSKHGNPKTTTDKVCKYFIDAVENGKYGWLWQCPNGGDKCMYRHSLPPGYVIFPNPFFHMGNWVRKKKHFIFGGRVVDNIDFLFFFFFVSL
jgi:hypothetical protein